MMTAFMDSEPCFCDLAVLEALNQLDEAGACALESYLAECPELAAELAVYQAAVAALPYSAPTAEPSAGLKERLFQRINAPMAADAAAIAAEFSEAAAAELSVVPASGDRLAEPALIVQQADLEGYSAVRASELSWQPYRIPGVSVATLHVDWSRRQATALLKAEAGISYPQHRHAGVEEIYMLQGDLVIDGTAYGAGDYIRSLPGSAHGPSTVGGCMFLVHTSLDDEYFSE